MDNYQGKWTAEEERALLDAQSQLGNSWKSIATLLNNMFDSEDRRRTAENVKDKFKSMGGENAADRVVGSWSLQETIQMIKCVERATKIQILYPLVDIKLKLKDEPSAEQLASGD